MPHRVHLDKQKKSVSRSTKMNHILLSKINKRRISSGQAYLQPAANDQVEQDVMDDADREEDEDGASESSPGKSARS